MDFEVSAVNVAAMNKALGARRDEVYALLSEQSLAIHRDPHAARWHSGTLAIEAWVAIIKLGGKQWLEDLNYEMTSRSFGPIVTPLIKIGLTLSGSSPASIFSRLGDTVTVAVKGLKFEWKPAGLSGGSESITYPCAMPADAVEAGWKGVFRVGGDLTGKTIRVDRFEAESDRQFRFDVSW